MNKFSYIDIEGNECQESKAVAKQTGSAFYVKTDREGLLLNPNSIYHVEGEEKSYNRRKGVHSYAFKKVTKECYDLYLRFLQTKNPAFLRNAERRLMQ